jgi:hypothetical protein|tara:strand:- start:158 stop:451 length:294 start_codon:yes stop_codon:yes gene_type:complete
MSFACSSTYNDVGDGSIIGGFREKDYYHFFEFSKNDPDHLLDGVHYPHKVWVGDVFGSPYRYATVKKTVAYILVDEDEYGEPVVEKWAIKEQTVYGA